MGNGIVSENTLMQKLVQAKKVMNMVDGGNYQKGQINTDILTSLPEDLTESQMPTSNPTRMPQPANAERIANSKLPDAIKKAMMENPIPQISLNETLDMSFLEGAKKLMEKEGLSKPKPQAVPPGQPQRSAPASNSSNLDMNAIAVIIENTVRKVLDEKLNQILTAQTTASINENLVLKVGDSIFKGKITGVNKVK